MEIYVALGHHLLNCLIAMSRVLELMYEVLLIGCLHLARTDILLRHFVIGKVQIFALS